MTRPLLGTMLVTVAACWTGTTTSPSQRQPASEVTTNEGAPARTSSRWRRSTARPAAVQTVSTRAPMDIARDLADEMRRSGIPTLSSFVAGPIVVLDLDAGTISTVCGAAAHVQAQTWGRMLSDQARHPPTCRPSTASYTCSQFAASQILIIELADPDHWQIVSVIVGNYRTGRAALSGKMSQMHAQVATATCP